MRQEAGLRTTEVVFAPGLGEAERRAYLGVPDITPRALTWLTWSRRGLVVAALAVAAVTLTLFVIEVVSDAGAIVDEARSSGRVESGRGETFVGPVLRLVISAAALYLLRQAKPHLSRAARVIGDAHRHWRRRGWRDEALDISGLPPRLSSAMRRLQLALARSSRSVADQALWDSARRALASVALQQSARRRPDRPDGRAALLVARQLANHVVDDADTLDAALEHGDRQWVFSPVPPDAPVVLPDGRSLPECTILAERLLPA